MNAGREAQYRCRRGCSANLFVEPARYPTVGAVLYVAVRIRCSKNPLAPELPIRRSPPGLTSRLSATRLPISRATCTASATRLPRWPGVRRRACDRAMCSRWRGEPWPTSSWSSAAATQRQTSKRRETQRRPRNVPRSTPGHRQPLAVARCAEELPRRGLPGQSGGADDSGTFIALYPRA